MTNKRPAKIARTIGAAAIVLATGAFIGGILQERGAAPDQRDSITCVINGNPISWAICPAINGGIDTGNFVFPELGRFWHKITEPQPPPYLVGMSHLRQREWRNVAAASVLLAQNNSSMT